MAVDYRDDLRQRGRAARQKLIYKAEHPQQPAARPSLSYIPDDQDTPSGAAGGSGNRLTYMPDEPAEPAQKPFTPTPTPLQPPVSRTKYKALADDIRAEDYVQAQKEKRDQQDPNNPILKAIKDNTIDLLAEGIDRVTAGATGFKPLDRTGRFINQLSQSAGNTVGVDTQAAGAAPLGSTGSHIADKTAQVAGNIAGFTVNPAALEQSLVQGGYNAANAALASDGGRALTQAVQRGVGKVGGKVGVSSRLTDKAVERGLTGAAAGAAQNVGLSGVRGETSPKELARSALEGALYGAGADLALAGLGGAVKRGVQARRQSVRDRPLNKEIEAFIGRTEEPRSPEEPVPMPPGRTAMQFPRDSADPGADMASNFRRGEKLLQQYDDAVEAQYQFLKKSMKERGGVQQGGLIHDPTTGEVVDRYGRTSNNPRWYRDIFAENGRKPTDKELRELAKKQINEGYLDDDAGQIPPWRPPDIEDIDGELASIREAAAASADPAERSALQQVADTLQTSRQQIKDQLPEGVHARARPLPPLKDNPVRPLTHYTDTLYRETSPEHALELIPGINLFSDMTGDHVYLANTKDLALGQGSNKGVMIEFDSGGLQGHVNKSKPTWEMSYQQGEAEFIAHRNSQKAYRDAVRSVTIAKDAKMNKVTQVQLKRVLSNWEKQENPDGSTTFFAQGKGPEVEQAPVAAGSAVGQDTPPEAPASSGGIAGESPAPVAEPAGKPAATETVGQAAGTPPPLPPVPPGASVPPAGSTPPAPGTKTISRTQLVENIKKKLGVTIDTGRMGVSKQVVAGIYKTQPEVIRTGTQGDYDTIAHEIGHHFDKVFNLKQHPALERELINMMDAQNVHDYKQYPRNHWFDEGIAEYFRTYLADPSQARQLAPQFSAFLDATLPKKVKAGLASVQKDIRTWIDQGAYNRAQGKIDFESGSRQEGFKWSKWYTKFVDDLHPLQLLEKALTGTVAMGKKSIYKLARNSRGVAEQAKMAVTRGIYDSAGNKLSDGLSQIIKPLEQVGMSEKDLAIYLAVRHAEDLKKLNKEVPFTEDEINEVKARWGSMKVVQDVHADIIKYNDALLKILNDAGIVSSQSIREMKTKYPNYVPFFRHFDDDTIAGFKGDGFGGAKAFANITTPLRKMTEEGSDRTLINPIESMVKNTFLAMSAAAKNRVGLQLAELAKIDGAGAWVEHVPGQKSAKEHIIDVYMNGKKQAYKIRDSELYNAMLSLDNESTNSLIKFLGGAASLLRGGATLTPEFMVRNVFRDVAGAMINSSKYGFNPLDFFNGLFHVITKSETFDRFVSSGGAMSTMMALDRDANREALEAVFKLSLKDKAMNVITDPKELAKWISLVRPVQKTVGLLRKGAEMSEFSTKVGSFNRALKKTNDLDEAAYTARDLMDFNRAGSAIRQANRAVAFLNASIQGTDKMVRAFNENKAGFLTRAFVTLVLPASAIYFWNKYGLSDEERAAYDNIPQWQKDTFYVVGIPGTGEFVRIPKPFEAGMLFATGTERAFRWIEDNDPEAFRAYGQAMAEAYTPPMLFTALTPLLEAITNHSFFRNAPVVPMGEERFEKKDQYGVYTSELAKDIGKFMDQIGLGESNFASPRIIDNTIRGYTAGLGQYGVDLIDEGIKAATGRETTPLPAKKLTEQPVARSFFASTAGGGQIRDDFYDRWEDLSKERASADFNEEPFEHQKEYLHMKPYQKEIARLQKQYKEIQKSKVLDPHAKRSQLDELDDKMNAAAEKALGK